MTILNKTIKRDGHGILRNGHGKYFEKLIRLRTCQTPPP